MSESQPRATGQDPVDPGLVADPAALIQAIGSGATDPMSLLLSQLTGQAQDDPRLALFRRLLEQRASAPEPEPRRPDEHEQEAALARRELNRRLHELGETVKRLYAELETLRKRNDKAAAAVGACYLCFGTDPLCAECGGRGKPGSRAPEPAAYRALVLPALLRIRRMQMAQGRPAPAVAGPAVGAMRPDAVAGSGGPAPCYAANGFQPPATPTTT